MSERQRDMRVDVVHVGIIENPATVVEAKVHDLTTERRVIKAIHTTKRRPSGDAAEILFVSERWDG